MRHTVSTGTTRPDIAVHPAIFVEFEPSGSALTQHPQLLGKPEVFPENVRSLVVEIRKGCFIELRFPVGSELSWLPAIALV